MENISRNIVGKNFRYTTNEYNHRFGCIDEEYKSYKDFIRITDHIKSFLYKKNLQVGAKVYIDINNMSFCYICLVIALAELRINIVEESQAEYVIGLHKDICIEELYNYKNNNLSLMSQISSRRAIFTDQFINDKTHRNIMQIATNNQNLFKGNILFVTTQRLQYHLDTTLLPCLISNSVNSIFAIGVNDIEQAKNKIEFLIQNHSIGTVVIQKKLKTYIHQEVNFVTFD